MEFPPGTYLERERPELWVHIWGCGCSQPEEDTQEAELGVIPRGNCEAPAASTSLGVVEPKLSSHRSSKIHASHPTSVGNPSDPATHPPLPAWQRPSQNREIWISREICLPSTRFAQVRVEPGSNSQTLQAPQAPVWISPGISPGRILSWGAFIKSQLIPQNRGGPEGRWRSQPRQLVPHTQSWQQIHFLLTFSSCSGCSHPL